MTHEPPSDHLELDRLADLEEDLLSPADAATGHRHLEQCASCRQRQTDLRTTRALLSTLPQEPMPVAVANRIEAALTALPATTIVPLASKRRSWRAHPTAAGLGAAATVAALVAALVIGRTSHRSTPNVPSEAAGTSGASAARTTVPLPTSNISGTRYTTANLKGKVEALLAPPATTAAMSAAAPSKAGGAAAPRPTTSRHTQATHIPAALSRLYGSPGALASCVLGLEEQSRMPIAEPLAIDFGEFKTTTGVTPAVVIVLPGIDDPTNYGAWVVGANCNRSDVDFLNYVAVPAPSSAAPSSAAPTPSPSG